MIFQVFAEHTFYSLHVGGFPNILVYPGAFQRSYSTKHLTHQLCLQGFQHAYCLYQLLSFAQRLAHLPFNCYEKLPP